MRASTRVAPVLLVLLGSFGLLGCGSTARDPIRPIERPSSTASVASVQANALDCVAPGPDPDPNAPVALIVNPRQSPVFGLSVPSRFTVTWSGSDPDGRVREYRFRLFPTHNPDFPNNDDFVAYVLRNPQVLEELYGACFETWDSALPQVTSHTYDNLQVGQRILFVVTAIDNDGKHDSNFGLADNLFAAWVVSPQSMGPQLSLSSGSWSYTSFEGGYLNDPSRYVDLAVAPGQPITVQWSALPVGGTPLEGYRWGLDLTDLGQGGPRGSGTPSGRWTARSLGNTSATVGPFDAGETHLLFVDVTDKIGMATLGIVRLNVTAGGAGPGALRASGGTP
jgi:hypothetical protein